MQSGESRILCVVVCYTWIQTLVSPIFEAINNMENVSHSNCPFPWSKSNKPYKCNELNKFILTDVIPVDNRYSDSLIGINRFDCNHNRNYLFHLSPRLLHEDCRVWESHTAV